MSRERLPFNTPLVVLVPGIVMGIAPASAVVALQSEYTAFKAGEKESLEVHYEGGINQPMSYQEKILHAAGRLLARYPTVARAWALGKDDVESVGSFVLETWALEITDKAAVMQSGISADDIEHAEHWVDPVKAARAHLEALKHGRVPPNFRGRR